MHSLTLADHYNVDCNVQQDSFVYILYSSSMQVPVSIKSQKLRPKIMNQKILNILKNT